MRVKPKTFGIFGLVLLAGLVGFAAGWVVCRLDAFHPWAIPATSLESEKLRWVEHADVVADFRQHVVQEHDMRFVSQYGLGFGSEFPGLSDTPETQRLLREHGSRRLESGSDIITSYEQERLQSEISTYATRYNCLLLGYLKCQK